MNKEIKIIDMPMGEGKTTGIINYMNNNPNNKYLFITPFLDEVQRIKDSCLNLEFKEPNDKYSKLSDLKKLIAEGENIASTHSLFSIIDSRVMELLRLNNYLLILDEVMEVVDILDMSIKDIKILIDGNIIEIEENGYVKVKDNNYKGKSCKFNNEINTIRNQNVYLVNNTLLVCLFNPDTFNCFEDIYVLTYLFRGSNMKFYCNLFNIDYLYYKIQNNNIVEGKFDDSLFRKKAKNLINIYEGKLNTIADNKNALSANWYKSRKKKEEHVILKKNIYNYLKNIIKSNSDEAMWSTLTGYNDEIKEFYTPKSYVNNTFVACNCRATNSFSHKKNLVYAVNIFINPYIYKYFLNNGIQLDENMYALSCLLQWIWRSCIRNNEEINIYIPSKRMRKLLISYLENK